MIGALFPFASYKERKPAICIRIFQAYVKQIVCRPTFEGIQQKCFQREFVMNRVTKLNSPILINGMSRINDWQSRKKYEYMAGLVWFMNRFWRVAAAKKKKKTFMKFHQFEFWLQISQKFIDFNFSQKCIQLVFR